ncbi:MAG: T9SS type A sorting domain-containing protein [bacterium]|nr:T9SS type A sorting domain-containing protein [bacterium]
MRISILLLHFTQAGAQQVGLTWVKPLLGQSGAVSKGTAIKEDYQGNVLSYGWFLNTVDFDPGPGTYTLNSLGDAPYITKFDASGNLIWARHFRNYFTSLSGSNTRPTKFDVDNIGNVYCTGIISDILDFDPGPGTYTMGPGARDAFICKLDPNGNFLWARQIADSGHGGADLIVDGNGDILIIGSFSSANNDFDPGPSTYSLSPFGGRDGYVCKLSSAGNFMWAKQLGGSGDDNPTSIALDAGGRLIVCGKFTAGADFDPGPGTYTMNGANGSAFVCTLSNAGSFVNAWQVGNSASTPVQIRIAGNGNNVLFVSFNTSVDADPGPGLLIFNPTGLGSNYFVGEYNSNGSLLWARHVAPGFAVAVFALKLDNTGGIYLGGSYNGTMDFDFGPGTYTLTTNANNNANSFIAKLNSNGIFVWARQIEGPAGDDIVALTTNTLGDIYSTGQYLGSNTDFDVGPGVYNLSANYQDAFVLKLSTCGSALAPIITSSALTSCGSGVFNFSASPTSSISWRSSLMSNSYLGFGASFTSSLLTAGNYSFYAAASNTCAESFPPALVQVSVFPTPTINISVSKTSYCFGETLTLTPSGASTYVLGTSTFSNSLVVAPNGNTLCTIYGTDSNSCTSSSTLQLIMDLCTGISPNESGSKVIIWPNPARDVLNIQMDNLFKVEVITVAGELMMQVNGDTDQTQLKLNLAPGFYLLRIYKTDNSQVEKKFVVGN